jgi:hypothetical protein
MSKKNLKITLGKSLYYIVLLSFILPIGYLVFRIISSENAEGATTLHSRADYVLMLVECVLGVLVIHIPSILARRFRFELPAVLYILYIIFLYCAIFLGEVRSFYYLVPHWDDFLHLFSSMMTGFFAFMVVTILNHDEKLVFTLSPVFVALFAFTFSVSIGALWEIYEYAGDGILGINMQKYMNAGGESLIGHAALTDTMEDIIIDMLGAFISAVAGYISIKNSKRWLVPILKDVVIADNNETAPEIDPV